MKINSYQTMTPFCPDRLSPGSRRFPTANANADRPEKDQDQVTISLFGQNSRVENLMRQKHFLLERKNELLHSTLENGGTRESIQELLDTYEEQMKNLDQQITQEITKQNTKQPEKDRLSAENDPPKTEEELQKEQIAEITIGA